MKINKFKKIYRIIVKFISFFFIKLIASIIKIFGYSISPSLDKINIFDFNYSPITRRLVFKENKDAFSKISIDMSLSNSILCRLGKKFSANKSPFNLNGHRSGYTALYDLLFARLRDKKITFAEIGIFQNSSIKMWRSYFSKAKIHGFEYNENYIKDAKKNKLTDTYYHKIDVAYESSINESFQQIKKKFDIILDDSTHEFNDQIRIIKNCHKYLNNNGILIIEDIFRYRNRHSERNYFNSLRGLKKYFHNITFVEINHVNNFTASWKCEKILLLVKK
jgi:predicted O-methyltransferase YrrM